MASRKYIPPHKRRSSSTRPPPVSANATYPNEQNNRYRKFARPYDSKQSRTNKFGHKIGINIKNQHTLQESNMDCNDINTINLDQYVSKKKHERQVIIEIISQYSDKDVSNTIMAFCGYKIVLIPNTFDRGEFLKHWFVIDKGTQINEHRDDHRVDLHSNYVQLIRRGAIASCKGYKPSKTAKLKLECRFMYHNKRDHITFCLQSKGMRDIHTDRAWSGEVFAQDQVMVYNQIGKQRSDKIWIKTRDENFSMEKILCIPSPSLHKELCIAIISDGEKMRVEYGEWNEMLNGKIHFIASECGSDLKGFHRVVIYNRFIENCVCDITHLQLSIVTEVDDE